MLAVRKAQPRVRPRHARVPAARQPQDPRLPARVRRRGDPVRGQPVARGAAGRARPRALQGPRAGRAARPHRVPADRRAAVPADATGARLLLVPARHRRRRRRAGTRSALVARGPAGARAVRRLEQPLPRPRGAVAHRHGRQDCARSSRPTCCRATSRRSAGTRPRAARDRARAHRRPRASGTRGRRQLAAAAARARRSGRDRDATSCRWRSPGKTATRSACARCRAAAIAKVRQQANVGVHGATRSPTKPSAARGRGDRRAARDARPRTAGSCSARPRRSREIAGDGLAALPVSRPQAQSSNTLGDARRAAVPQGLPAAAPRRQSRIRDRPLPDRGRATSALRAARRHARVRGQRRQPR